MAGNDTELERMERIKERMSRMKDASLS